MDDASSDLSRSELTNLLRCWQRGDVEARDRVFHEVEKDLHRRAERFLQKERSNHTLQATALVNEAYLRLVDSEDLDWKNRSHFFAIASTVMRRVLVDHARKRLAGKRGSELDRVALVDNLISNSTSDEEIVAVHQALNRLARSYPRQARAVEMRFFVGMRLREIAEALDVSLATVKNELRLGRAWLLRTLGD